MKLKLKMYPKSPHGKKFFSATLSRQANEVYFNFEAETLAGALDKLQRIQLALHSLKVTLADTDDKDIFTECPPNSDMRAIFVKARCPHCEEWWWVEVDDLELAPCWVDCAHCGANFHIFDIADLQTLFKDKAGCDKCQYKVDCLVVPPI